TDRNLLFLLDAGTGGLRQLPYAGGRPVGLSLDPNDWRRAYVLDGNGQVWRTLDAGGSFTRITGNLALAVGPGPGQNLAGIDVCGGPAGPNDEAVFVGSQNGVFASSNPWAADPATVSWARLGLGLPNATISGLTYDPMRNILVVGTLGRGIWALPQ